MGSITSYCVKVIKDNFKLLTWLQIFIIAIAPNFIFFQAANATTVAGEGWNVTKSFVRGASTFYDGTKNVMLNGQQYLIKGSAYITPTAGQVAKMIVRTGAVLAVDLAIKALIGAVDYVMDPANNQVIYYDRNNPTNCLFYSYIVSAGPSYKACGLEAAANLAKPYLESTDEIYKSYSLVSCSRKDPSDITSAFYYSGTCTFSRIHKRTGESSTSWFSVNHLTNPAYSPENNKKTLPYDAVGSQIISDANSDNANAKAYVSSVADTALEQDEQKQLVPAQDVINQLEYNKTIPTTETAQGQSTPRTDPNDPTAPKAPPTDITINFPVFCSWAPTVCQAAQSGIDFVKSYLDDSKALKKEYADNPKFDDKPLQFDKDPATPDTTISFGGGCPAPLNAPYSFMGISGSIEIPFTPFCKIAEVSKPVIIAVSAYFAALIIGGIRVGDA
ncbi:virulence factor TspB C-terminal domain-related protein [Acinetobacter baumannii]|uniref:virulence factor TspB C-terminal domain-related protein n=1 Tax=Acinetobacter baumannii TaxID=470 RepID=UPI00396CCBE2